MQYNRCAFAGFLGRDPEVRYTSSGTAICNFSLAVSKRWKDNDGNKKEETAWIDCQAWGKTGENFGEICYKGSNVFVEGEMKQDTWKDKKTDQKRSKLVLNVRFWQILHKREDDGGERDRGEESRSREGSRSQREKEPEYDDDDVPF